MRRSCNPNRPGVHSPLPLTVYREQKRKASSSDLCNSTENGTAKWPYRRGDGYRTRDTSLFRSPYLDTEKGRAKRHLPISVLLTVSSITRNADDRNGSPKCGALAIPTDPVSILRFRSQCPENKRGRRHLPISVTVQRTERQSGRTDAGTAIEPGTLPSSVLRI